MREKRAATDSPIHELLATHWSPYAFQDRPVPEADLPALFEAARWAPSSYNEQPWSYIVATKESPEQFGHLVSCLVEGKQIWAQACDVCQADRKWDDKGFDNPPWQGVKKGTKKTNGVELKCQLSTPHELKCGTPCRSARTRVAASP